MKNNNRKIYCSIIFIKLNIYILKNSVCFLPLHLHVLSISEWVSLKAIRWGWPRLAPLTVAVEYDGSVIKGSCEVRKASRCVVVVHHRVCQGQGMMRTVRVCVRMCESLKMGRKATGRGNSAMREVNVAYWEGHSHLRADQHIVLGAESGKEVNCIADGGQTEHLI